MHLKIVDVCFVLFLLKGKPKKTLLANRASDSHFEPPNESPAGPVGIGLDAGGGLQAATRPSGPEVLPNPNFIGGVGAGVES